jgi:hypothetical protein
MEVLSCGGSESALDERFLDSPRFPVRSGTPMARLWHGQGSAAAPTVWARFAGMTIPLTRAAREAIR